MKKFSLLVLVFLLTVTGCSKNGSSFTTFSIQGFEEFFDFYATQDDKESYIQEGKIEFARVGNLYVCPFIKEINYDESSLFFYVYALEDISIESLVVSDVLLSTRDNKILLDGGSQILPIKLNDSAENIQLGMTSIAFESSDTWLYNSNALHLSFCVAVDEENIEDKQFSYDISIIR